MQLVNNVFKYLENFSIDYFKLDHFNETSVKNFNNYIPSVNTDIISTNNCSLDFGNVTIDTPIVYNFDNVCNFSDRKTIEIDVYSTSDIDVDSVNLSVCSGVNGNAVRGSFKNTNKCDANTLTTLVFDLGNVNNTRLRQYSNIRSLKIEVDNDSFFICGIGAYNSEYIITYDEFLKLVVSASDYVKNKINSNVLPYSSVLFEAVYKMTAYYIWQRESVTPRNTKKGFVYLKEDANELIKYYLNGGYHPNLMPYTDTVKKTGSNVNIDVTKKPNLNNHKELMDLLDM